MYSVRAAATRVLTRVNRPTHDSSREAFQAISRTRRAEGDATGRWSFSNSQTGRMKPAGIVAQWLTGRDWKVTCWKSRPKNRRRQMPKFTGETGSNHHRRHLLGRESADWRSESTYATVRREAGVTSLVAVTAGLLPGGRLVLLGRPLCGVGIG